MKQLDQLNILVIEDDKPTSDRIVQSLRELGFSGATYQAADGAKGLEKIKQLGEANQSLDLVICDIIMPVKTGLEMLKELRASTLSYAKIPVLMLTSKSDTEVVIKSVQLGADQYLLKPWTTKNLYNKIFEVMKNAGEKENT